MGVRKCLGELYLKDLSGLELVDLYLLHMNLGAANARQFGSFQMTKFSDRKPGTGQPISMSTLMQLANLSEN